MNKYLINSGSNYGGIYRGKLLTGDKLRVYVVGVHSINPFNSDGSINNDIDLSNYPIFQWCAYNIESTQVENIIEPIYIMFENGDIRQPVCISYNVIGGGNDSSDDSTESTDSSSTPDDSDSGSPDAISPNGDVIETAINVWIRDCNGKSYGRGANQYDCSSSTSHAFIQAGVLPNGQYTTYNAVQEYTKAGFVDVTNSVGLDSYNNLKRGDVLWANGHMCIYLGNGQVTKSNSRGGNYQGDWYKFATRVFRYGN